MASREVPHMKASPHYGDYAYSRPTIRKLVQIVIRQTTDGAGVVPEWEQLGLELGVDKNILDVIKEDIHDSEKRCIKMFEKWLAKFSSATWNDLIQALENIGTYTAANEVEKSLKREESAMLVAKEDTSSSSTIVDLHRTEVCSSGLSFSKDDHIYTAFRKLTWQYVESLGSKPFTQVVMECNSYCKKFYKVNPVFLKNLKSSSCMEELFDALDDSPFFNFLSLELLRHLARFFNITHLLSLTDNYVSTFASMTLNDILSLTRIPKHTVEGEEKYIKLTRIGVKLRNGNISYGEVVNNFVCSLSEQVLTIDVGSVLCDGLQKSSVIVTFYIPSYLKICAIQSAFNSIKALLNLNLEFIEIDSYRVEPGSNSDIETPMQILCKNYGFLLKNLKPSTGIQILFDKNLLHQVDINIINVAFSQYAKVTTILEFLRRVDVPSLFVFCYKLMETVDEHVGTFLLSALESAGFSVTKVPQNHQLMCYDFTEKAKMPVDQFFKCLRHKKQLLSSNSNCYQLCFMDFVDQLCDVLTTNVPNATEIIKVKCSELMASVSHKIKLFSTDYMQVLHQCGQVTTLLRALTCYLTWYSHSILSVLLESCNCPAAMELLNDYNAKTDYIESISDHPIPLPCSLMVPDEDSVHTILTTKLNTGIFFMSLKYIKEIRITMAEEFEVSEHSFQLLAVNKNPVVLFWMILKALVPLISARMQECRDYLNGKGWAEICIYPNTLYVIDGHVNVGSLAYLQSQFSEKWGDTIKTQLNRVEKLPELLVNYNQEIELFKQVQSDEKDGLILHLKEKITQLEEECRKSKSLASNYHEENFLLAEESLGLKKTLTARFVEIQSLQHEVRQNASRKAFTKVDTAIQTDLDTEGQSLQQELKIGADTSDIVRQAMRPKLSELYREVTPQYAIHWKNIGISLGLSEDCLSIIAEGNAHNAMQCCKDMLNKWLHTDSAATWTRLYDVLDIVSTLDFAYSDMNHILKKMYYQHGPDLGNWPPVIFKYLPLACIYYQKATLTTSEVSTAMELFHKIFERSMKCPKRVLIGGAAGSGKTMLSKEICYQWAKGNLLLSDKLMLLLLARDPTVQKITNVNELIEYYFLSVFSTAKLNVVVEDLKKASSQRHITIVIDGFDELNTELQQKSFLRDIIEGKVLENAKVVITSRPSASSILHHCIDDRIEIMGFSEESRQRYILGHCFDDFTKLQEHFQLYPNIDALCYNPICLNIVIFMCSLGSLPSTATEMYDSFLVHAVHRHLSKAQPIVGESSICTVEDFPMSVRNALQEIQKFAYDSLSKDKTVFSLEDLPDVSKDDPTCLGLVHAVEHYSSDKVIIPNFESPFTFLHLGIQEYLAARYVASLSNVDILSRMEESFLPECEEFIYSDDTLSANNSRTRFANMWIYYFGIVGKTAIDQFLFTQGSSTKVESTFNPVVKGLFKNPVNALYLFQCFQETKDIEMCSLLYNHFENNAITFTEKLQPHLVSSLGYFLLKSERKWDELKLHNCQIQDYGVNILHGYLARESEVVVKNINLCNNGLTAASSLLVGKLIVCLKANCVLLSYNKINLNDIANVISGTEFLKEIWLMDTGITQHDAGSLADLMDCGLVELYIGSNQLGDEGAKILSQAVGKSSSLMVLDISSNDIRSEGATAMAAAVQKTRSLSTLWIGNNAIGHDGATAIGNAMPYSKSLKELYLNDVTVNSELALLLLNSAFENDNITLLCLPTTLCNQDVLKSSLNKINSKPSRSNAPLNLTFL